MLLVNPLSVFMEKIYDQKINNNINNLKFEVKKRINRLNFNYGKTKIKERGTTEN